MKMNICIERLVLDGLTVPYHQQPELQAALEMELAHLFAVHRSGDGLLTGGSVSHVSGGDIPSVDERNPDHLGRQIARAIYEGVNR